MSSRHHLSFLHEVFDKRKVVVFRDVIFHRVRCGCARPWSRPILLGHGKQFTHLTVDIRHRVAKRVNGEHLARRAGALMMVLNE